MKHTHHDGMGLRRFSEDVATAARLSSAALAHAALVGGCDKALPVRGAMGLEADAKGACSQARSAALADLARLRSCAGSLASAWLTARPDPA